MRGVSASPHHQLLLPGSETVLQTRLPTVSASLVLLLPCRRPGTRAPPPPTARPASAQRLAPRTAGPISSEGCVGCATPDRG